MNYSPPELDEDGRLKRCAGCGREFTFENRHATGRICEDCVDLSRSLRGREPAPRIRKRRKGDIPERLRWRVFKRDGFACKLCGAQEMLRADHIMPESKGGPTTLDNLQTLCDPCNTKKGRH
jgi:5-methylcytosine-specific restriction endonuclease McrA